MGTYLDFVKHSSSGRTWRPHDKPETQHLVASVSVALEADDLLVLRYVVLNPFAAVAGVVVESFFLDHCTCFVVEFHRVYTTTMRMHLESYFSDCEIFEIDRGSPGPVVSVFTQDCWALDVVGKLHLESKNLAAVMQPDEVNLAQLDLLF